VDDTVPNQLGLGGKDTPYMTDAPTGQNSNFADVISSMDLTFQARLYLVWEFTDFTIYTLARVDWQVVFKASRVNGVLTPDAAAVISAQPFVRTAQDPAAVLEPSFNTSFGFYSWG
jgi:hypothetical protein